MVEYIIAGLLFISTVLFEWITADSEEDNVDEKQSWLRNIFQKD